MFSFPYFRQIVKSNIKFLAAFTLVLCVFLIVMTNVFTPEAVSGLQSATEGTLAAQILTGNGTLISFMANSFYALMAIVFPMVYSIIVGNRMIAEKVDKGSMAGFLSTPTKQAAAYADKCCVLCPVTDCHVGCGLCGRHHSGKYFTAGCSGH